MLKKHRLLSLSILSGILVGTSYIPFPPWALFFCLCPLWTVWWNEKSYKKIFFSGWITQFVLTLIGFHWIAYTVVEFGRMPWPMGILILLLYCAVAHLHYPIAGLIWLFLNKKMRANEWVKLLSLPVIFGLTERFYPFLFYWHLGYPWLWAKLPGYHLAEWIGFFGLNLVTLFVNALIFRAVQKGGYQWRNKRFFAPAALLILTQLIGLWISIGLQKPDQTLRVLTVQGNIGNLEKIMAEHGGRASQKAVDTFIRLTEAKLQEDANVPLIIWPETAFPEVIRPRTFGVQKQRLHNLAQTYQAQILTGAYEYRDRRPYNSMVLLDGQDIVDSYQKTHLLAFGEYFPLSDRFPILRQWFPMVADFGRGPGPQVMRHHDLKFGPQICYEGLFDEFALQQKVKGAQFFVNVTNDSWYGHTFEAYQHMFMTLARAVENRIPLIRATNTGITTAILASGEVLTFSPQQKEWAHVYEVPFHSTPSPTFYARLGLHWPWILIALLALLYGGDWFVRARKYRLGQNTSTSG